MTKKSKEERARREIAEVHTKIEEMLLIPGFRERANEVVGEMMQLSRSSLSGDQVIETMGELARLFTGDMEVLTDQHFKFDAWADDAHGWDYQTGAPGIGLFGNTVQVWSVLQPEPVTVGDVVRAFSVRTRMVVEAIEAHPWMLLAGDPTRPVFQTIEHDGDLS